MKGDRFLGLYAKFDAKLIILQMICNQLVYYCGLTLLFFILDFSFGVSPHFGQYFHYSVYSTDHIYGMIALVSNFLNMAVLIFGLYIIVEKANKVLDFVLTVYFFHFVSCAFYNKTIWLPWSWFVANGIFMIITIFAGEYVLLQGEQQEIKLFENIMSPKKKGFDESESNGIELNNPSAFSEPSNLRINNV